MKLNKNIIKKMKFLNREKDNIISIVKSLRPINYLYSKQNKDYDKFFRSSSLKGLIRQINARPKYNEFLKPGESLEELNNKNNTILNVNFKSTFNYLEELSNLKNLPMVLVNKKLFKRGRFNDDYAEHSLNSNEKRKKNRENEKKKKKEKIAQIKNSGDADVTLDPGRYHPNYNFIKKRYPCAYLGKPKVKEDSFHKENNKNEEETINKHNNNNINHNNENDDIITNRIIKSRNNKIKNSNIYHEKKLSNKMILLNINNKNKKMNVSSPNFYSVPKTLLSKNNENKNVKIISEIKKNNIKLKDHNTVSSWSHATDLDRSKKINDLNKALNKNKNKNNYYTSQRTAHSTYFLKNNKKLNKNASEDNLRCTIIFDKMPGRDRPINFVDGGWEGCRTNYNPDYNIIRPHIPSTIFKSKRKYQNYKKYITGKIIRSYCYSPDQYFVFEIKDKKENDLSGKYGTIIAKS